MHDTRKRGSAAFVIVMVLRAVVIFFLLWVFQGSCATLLYLLAVFPIFP